LAVRATPSARWCGEGHLAISINRLSPSIEKELPLPSAKALSACLKQDFLQRVPRNLGAGVARSNPIMAKRVYFAFHYKDVAEFRANVVRNHNVPEGIEKAGYFDASIWEEARQKDPAALKRLINKELENTSVTAVLIGSETWARPWVRYEIFKSLQRGNKLIGIHINSIAGSVNGKSAPAKQLGYNPFEYLALAFSQDGTEASPTEWENGSWQNSPKTESWRLEKQREQSDRGAVVQVTRWSAVYDWVTQDGYNKFSDWIT
jgi:hypothetical protein